MVKATCTFEKIIRYEVTVETGDIRFAPSDARRAIERGEAIPKEESLKLISFSRRVG